MPAPMAPAESTPESPGTLKDSGAAQLLCRIEETLAQPHRWLRFPADVEQRFERDSLQHRNRAM